MFNNERCSAIELGCRSTFRRKLRSKSGTCPVKKWEWSSRIRFVTCADLAASAVRLASLLPPKVSRIVGIPRSGMMPAAIIASLLHRPLYTLRKDSVESVGGGARVWWGDIPDYEGVTVFVDDTTHNGGTIGHLKKLGAPINQGIMAVCYALNSDEVDVFAEVLPTPHILEWNLSNAPWSSALAVDLDGIVCHNPPEQHVPLYLFRRDAVKAIITARPTAERRATMEWLDRWGVLYRELVMWDGSEADRWNPDLVGQWKAEHCRRLKCDFYIESEPELADAMRRHGVRVLCPKQGYME